MSTLKKHRILGSLLAAAAFGLIAGCEGSGGFDQTLPDPPDNGGSGGGSGGGTGGGGSGGGGGTGGGGSGSDDGDPTGSFGSDFQTIFNTGLFEAPTDPDTITLVSVDIAADPVGVPDPGAN